MLTNISTIFTRINKSQITEKLVLLSILLLPILSLSVRHWLSGFYSLIALIGLLVVFRQPHKLYKEERILFALLALLLISFAFSATLNGWSDNSIRRLGTVLKYLLFIPVYLLLRQFRDLSSYLFVGIVLGGAILGLQALFDVSYLGLQQGWGIYGSIIFGDLSILFFSITLIVLFFTTRHSKITYLYIISLLLSALAVYLSGSRNAWLASVVSVSLIPLLCFSFMKFKRTALVIIPILLVTASASLFTDNIQKRLALAINEYQSFMAEGAPKDIPLSRNSVGTRLEQWRVAMIIIKEAPYFGFGGGNAGKHVTRYAQKGLAHPDLINPDTEKGIGGLHSTYFESLINEGTFGLIIMLLFLLYPIYVFSVSRKFNPLLSSVGIIFMINYMIFGISENPFVHDNFSSVYLIFLSVFFSEIVRNKYTNKTSSTIPIE